jgi:hypothetical protein
MHVHIPSSCMVIMVRVIKSRQSLDLESDKSRCTTTAIAAHAQLPTKMTLYVHVDVRLDQVPHRSSSPHGDLELGTRLNQSQGAGGHSVFFRIRRWWFSGFARFSYLRR